MLNLSEAFRTIGERFEEAAMTGNKGVLFICIEALRLEQQGLITQMYEETISDIIIPKYLEDNNNVLDTSDPETGRRYSISTPEAQLIRAMFCYLLAEVYNAD